MLYTDITVDKGVNFRSVLTDILVMYYILEGQLRDSTIGAQVLYILCKLICYSSTADGGQAPSEIFDQGRKS